MEIRIDRVSDVKQGQYGPQSTIHSGNERYYVNSDASEYAGKLVNAEVVEKQGRSGKPFKIAKILGVVKEQGYANGAVQPWSEWEALAARAHQLAKVLEPDEIQARDNPESAPFCDRSRARMSFVATVLIAFSNGKIAMEDEGVIPF